MIKRRAKLDSWRRKRGTILLGALELATLNSLESRIRFQAYYISRSDDTGWPFARDFEPSMNQDRNFIVFLSPLFLGGNSGRATNGRSESAIIKGVRKKREKEKRWFQEMPDKICVGFLCSSLRREREFLFGVHVFPYFLGGEEEETYMKAKTQTNPRESIRISWISHRIIKLCCTTELNADTIEKYKNSIFSATPVADGNTQLLSF